MNSLWKRLTGLTITQLLTLPLNNPLPNPRFTGVGALTAIPITAMPTAPVTLTTSATLTAAQVLTGLLLANQGGGAAATYTMPTGTLLAAELAKTCPGMKVGDCFEVTFVNISTAAAEDVTIQGGTDTTAVGNMTIASNAAVADQAWGTFRFRKTGGTTFSFYRVG